MAPDRVRRYARENAKVARYWPHKKNDPPPGAPNIHTATETEIKAVQKLITNSTTN